MNQTKIVCWNCRGALSKGFPRLVKDLISYYHIDIMILLEPRCSGDKAEKVIGKIGFNSSWRVEAVGYSGGIWILWDSLKVNVSAFNSINQCITVEVNVSSSSFFLSCVYTSPRMTERNILWDHLVHLSDILKDTPWTCLGDFNAYLLAEEKSGGANPNYGSMNNFQNCVDKASLVDTGFAGPAFTWSTGSVWERLDRCLCNSYWFHCFENSSLLHLNQLKSDHRPIFLRLANDVQGGKPSNNLFKFQAAWSTHKDFKDFVSSHWPKNSDWCSAASTFSSEVKV